MQQRCRRRSSSTEKKNEKKISGQQQQQRGATRTQQQLQHLFLRWALVSLEKDGPRPMMMNQPPQQQQRGPPPLHGRSSSRAALEKRRVLLDEHTQPSGGGGGGAARQRKNCYGSSSQPQSPSPQRKLVGCMSVARRCRPDNTICTPPAIRLCTNRNEKETKRPKGKCCQSRSSRLLESPAARLPPAAVQEQSPR